MITLPTNTVQVQIKDYNELRETCVLLPALEVTQQTLQNKTKTKTWAKERIQRRRER